MEREKLSSANLLPSRKIINKKNRTRFPSIAELKEIEKKKTSVQTKYTEINESKLKAHARYVLAQQNMIPDNKGRV